MARKNVPHDVPEDAHEVSSSKQPGASAMPDLSNVLADNIKVLGRIVEWVQEAERAQLEVLIGCSSAMAEATSAGQGTPGWEGVAATGERLGEAIVAAVRDGQDHWIRATVALHGDLLAAMRERADQLRAQFRPAATSEGAAPMAPAFDPLEAMSQARQSLDAWMAQWSATFAPRPVTSA